MATSTEFEFGVRSQETPIDNLTSLPMLLRGTGKSGVGSEHTRKPPP